MSKKLIMLVMMISILLVLGVIAYDTLNRIAELENRVERLEGNKIR